MLKTSSAPEYESVCRPNYHNTVQPPWLRCMDMYVYVCRQALSQIQLYRIWPLDLKVIFGTHARMRLYYNLFVCVKRARVFGTMGDARLREYVEQLIRCLHFWWRLFVWFATRRLSNRAHALCIIADVIYMRDTRWLQRNVWEYVLNAERTQLKWNRSRGSDKTWKTEWDAYDDRTCDKLVPGGPRTVPSSSAKIGELIRRRWRFRSWEYIVPLKFCIASLDYDFFDEDATQGSNYSVI